jgi:hypothetical protein
MRVGLLAIAVICVGTNVFGGDARFSETADLALIAAPPGVAEPIDFWTLAERLKDGGAVIYDAACCKICQKGKACGNSCISRSYKCHKGRGCACDG